MQRIQPHPTGASNRFVIPYCTRPQEAKSGSLPRVPFDSAIKPPGSGVSLAEASAAAPGPGMRRIVARSEDVIDLGAQIKLRIVWPAYPNLVLSPLLTSRGPMTRGQLLSAVAAELIKYFEMANREKENLKVIVPPAFTDFDIVGRPKIRISNIVIMALVHLGSNIWQADLELEL